MDTADLQQKVFNYLKEQKRCQNLMKMDTSNALSELVEEITISQPILVRFALAPPFDVCVLQITFVVYYRLTMPDLKMSNSMRTRPTTMRPK